MEAKKLTIGKITYDGKFIIIDGPYEYDFTIERLKKESDLIGWLHHLSEKNWFTGEMARNLIEVYIAIHNKNESDYFDC